MNRGAFVGSVLAAALPLPAGAADLRTEVESAAAYSTGVVGAYARSLGKTGSFGYNADERFPSASVIKVLIMTSVFQQADRDPDVLAHKVKLELSDFVGGSDILQNYNPGDRVTVSLLLHAMIEQSDNTASNALITMLGFDAAPTAPGQWALGTALFLAGALLLRRTWPGARAAWQTQMAALA